MRQQIHRLSINDLLTLLETLHTNNIYSSIPVLYVYIYMYTHIETLISDATDTRRYSSRVASIQLG